MNLDRFIEENLPSDNEINESRAGTWNKNHPGFSWKKDIAKPAEEMKKHPKKISNPWALRQWQTLPKFKKEREAAAEKAARNR